MNYYHDSRNVDNYIHMALGYDGKALIEILKSLLPKGSSVLEIGMGPGKDLDLLNVYFNAVGTDESDLFVDRYKYNNPKSNVFKLDAIEMDINEKFDCFYSNKVLMHLSREQMLQSLIRQKALLKEGGLLFHSLWKGSDVEFYDGLRFVYYDKKILTTLLENDFEIVEMQLYKEVEEDDSLYIVLK